ncbi:MAG: hypothetical protein J2P37_36440 [Ktedonobacteraceae bacterium]|nr:hypothetical protein [Ktedonobacteraceae bacterium]
MPDLMIPVVHLNGTSRDELLKQITDAIEAVNTAMGALQKAAPHGRDYYVQSSTAIMTAMNQHYDRLEKLRDVRDELQRIGEAIIDQ